MSKFTKTWIQYNNSLSESYQYWQLNIQDQNVIWPFNDFKDWIYQEYRLEIIWDPEHKTLIQYDSEADWLRFWLEWG